MPSYELPSAGIWSTLHIDSVNSSGVLPRSRPSYTSAANASSGYGYSHHFPLRADAASNSFLPSEWRQRGEALSQSLLCDRTKSARQSSEAKRASTLKWHNLYNNPLLSPSPTGTGANKPEKWAPPVLDSRFTYIPPPASRGSVPHFSPNTFSRLYSPLTPRDQLILSCVEFDLNKAQPERVYQRRDADGLAQHQHAQSHHRHRYNNDAAEQILAASAAAAGLHSDSSIHSNSMAGSAQTSSGITTSSDDLFSGSASLSGATSSSTSKSGGGRGGGGFSSGDESSHGWTTVPREQHSRRRRDDSRTNSMEFGSPVTHRTDMSSLLGLTPLTAANNTTAHNRSQQQHSQRDELSEASDLSLLSPLTPVSFLSTGRPSSSSTKPPRHTMNRAASAGSQQHQQQQQQRAMKQQQAAAFHQEYLDEAARVRDIVRAEQAKQAGSIQRLLSSGGAASRSSPPLESIPSASSSNEQPGSSSSGSRLTSSSSNHSPSSSNFYQRGGDARFEQQLSPASYFGREDDYSRRTHMDSELLSITHLSHSD